MYMSFVKILYAYYKFIFTILPVLKQIAFYKKQTFNSKTFKTFIVRYLLFIMKKKILFFIFNSNNSKASSVFNSFQNKDFFSTS